MKNNKTTNEHNINKHLIRAKSSINSKIKRKGNSLTQQNMEQDLEKNEDIIPIIDVTNGMEDKDIDIDMDFEYEC